MSDDEQPKDFVLDQVERIINAMNQDKPVDVLHETDLLLKTMPDDFKKEHEFNELEDEIRVLLSTHKNIRLLRINQRVKQDVEMGLEYYGDDIGTDKRLFYNIDVEDDLQVMYEKIRGLLGVAVKEQGEEMNYD